jgi:hypothetical protein
MQDQGKRRGAFMPHPYALLLPALTEDEYAALRSDIAAHGILVLLPTWQASRSTSRRDSPA